MQCRSSCEMNLDTLKKKRKAEEAFEEYEYVYGIVTTATDCVLVILIIMASELESLKQRITELEAKNDKLEAENAELRKENTEIHDLRIKLSISDAEIAQLKRMNAETLRANGEYNERRDVKEKKLEAKIKEMESEFRDRFTKVEQKQSLIDNSSNNTSSNFNLVAEPTVTQHEKPLVDEEMDTSLPEEPILEGLTEVTVSAVNISVMDQCDQKSLEDKGTVAFLVDEQKKKDISSHDDRSRK
ncbi:unnamed protein product [Rhizophagus irregularis]|nr:unnamed protein product [Rhizophagus irregularis]